MKLKSLTIILEILLFIVGLTGCTMIFMGIKLPTTMIALGAALLIINSSFDFIKTGKLRKVVYPLILIYFLVGIPIMEKFIENEAILMGFSILGCVITIIFIYKDSMITKKEKNHNINKET
ncbi:hypothetical protein G9F73_015925 [Clostridium estertheticum]|uniref:hypothetical protein n=1 Tax=Clostridium estertheticum TaxID=238834 RepID=UPI0013EE9F47|nr:hypothetical protein [Clostridium estertheticum]MBZ9609280.1 hypothetical protein [Clostridium estertheticum]